MGEWLLVLRLLLAALLYLFLGVALYVMWRGLRPEDTVEAGVPTQAEVIVEPEEGDTIAVALRPITAIGRAEDNAIVVDDPFASTHHAIILWREARWWLEDLESHNGTYLNEEPVAQPKLLSPGDRIRIGKTMLRFTES